MVHMRLFIAPPGDRRKRHSSYGKGLPHACVRTPRVREAPRIQTSDEERIAGPRSFVGDRMARARGVVVEGPRRVDPADAAEAGAPDATERGRAKAVVAEDFAARKRSLSPRRRGASGARSSARSERAKSGVGASAEPVLESRVGADAVERGHLRVHDHPSKYILRSPEAKKTGPTAMLSARRPTRAMSYEHGLEARVAFRRRVPTAALKSRPTTPCVAPAFNPG